jgi:ABC-type transporter Mla MlaB component
MSSRNPEAKAMLNIKVEEGAEEIRMTLQGQIAGPEVPELNRAWAEVAPRLHKKRLAIDLGTVTHSDAAGMELLAEIYQRTQARLLTMSLWSEYLALEIMYGREDGVLANACE